jgi:hypothetical protein
MNEQRRAKRKPIESHAEVINAITGASMGRVGNISANGMMLIANQAVPEDALFQVHFHLPSKRGRQVPLELGLHEQWSEPASTPGQFWAGFRIIDISPQDLELLTAWVEDNA